MRIATLLTAGWLMWPWPVAAEILCAPLSTKVSIGNVEARPALKSFMSVLPVACRNTGASRARQAILISIDDATPVLINRAHDAELRLQAGFRHGDNPPAPSLCREVDLAARESTVIDLPIHLTMRIRAPHHGTYGAAIPVSVTNVAAVVGGDSPCP